MEEEIHDPESGKDIPGECIQWASLIADEYEISQNFIYQQQFLASVQRREFSVGNFKPDSMAYELTVSRKEAIIIFWRSNQTASAFKIGMVKVNFLFQLQHNLHRICVS